ncbi:MAG: hypothetical protein HC890_19465 [Chloroflexaceae bacterium]|nr:hypothetical protein [Chloroflexaceae bacterium]
MPPRNRQLRLKSEPNTKTPGVETELTPPATETAIVGQMYVNNLLLTLFPHRQQRRDPDKNSLE